MNETRPADYYSAREVASRMGVSKMTIYRMVHRGELPGAIFFGHIIRIHKVTFDLYLAEQQQDQGAGDVDQVDFQMDDEEREALR